MGNLKSVLTRCLRMSEECFQWGIIDSILLFCCGWGEIDNVRCVIIEPEKEFNCNGLQTPSSKSGRNAPSVSDSQKYLDADLDFLEAANRESQDLGDQNEDFEIDCENLQDQPENLYLDWYV